MQYISHGKDIIGASVTYFTCNETRITTNARNHAVYGPLNNVFIVMMANIKYFLFDNTRHLYFLILLIF